MAKFDLIVADCPWGFSDGLTMSAVKRGAESQYKTLTIEQLKSIPVADVAADNCVLAFWVVGSQLQEGMDVMKAWGFRQTQTWVWVKTKQVPLEDMIGDIKKRWKEMKGKVFTKDKSWAYPQLVEEMIVNVVVAIADFNLNKCLSFNMGRLFRQTHEICLLGVKGKVYDKLKNKSQRSVCFDVPLKHSAKTEFLQDRLDLMFGGVKKLELFGRRARSGWTVVGNECPTSMGEDIFASIERLKAL